MNLLVFLPGRVLYYYKSNCYQISFSADVSANRYEILEDFEASLSQKKEKLDIDTLLIKTNNLPEPEFWNMIFENSVHCKKLVVHHLGGKLLPIELLLTLDCEWSLSFAIQYINEKTSNGTNNNRLADDAQFLFIVNPGEPELKYVGEEAVRIMEILSDQYSVRLIHRRISEFEYYEALGHADCLFYFGHARFLDGHPIIELTNGWTPMFPGVVSGRLSLFVLAACLETRGAMLKIESDCCLYSNCRIADRKNVYLEEFVTALIASKSVIQSVFQANQADFNAGDIRRFIYRIQGDV